ncbi:MAG: hypothetical protein AAEJ16_07180, partial [Arenicellales bacterium]
TIRISDGWRMRIEYTPNRACRLKALSDNNGTGSDLTRLAGFLAGSIQSVETIKIVLQSPPLH